MVFKIVVELIFTTEPQRSTNLSIAGAISDQDVAWQVINLLSVDNSKNSLFLGRLS